jgi:hypothetical protein
MAKEETMAMIHHVCYPTDIFEIPGVLNDDDMKMMMKYINNPVTERDVIRPRKKWDDKHNSSILQFQSIPNTAYIFPSWLKHYVPPNISKSNRISISWNISLVGQVGEHHEFQSAEYK